MDNRWIWAVTVLAVVSALFVLLLVVAAGTAEKRAHRHQIDEWVNAVYRLAGNEEELARLPEFPYVVVSYPNMDRLTTAIVLHRSAVRVRQVAALRDAYFRGSDCDGLDALFACIVLRLTPQNVFGLRSDVEIRRAFKTLSTGVQFSDDELDLSRFPLLTAALPAGAQFEALTNLDAWLRSLGIEASHLSF